MHGRALLKRETRTATLGKIEACGGRRDDGPETGPYVEKVADRLWERRDNFIVIEKETERVYIADNSAHSRYNGSQWN